MSNPVAGHAAVLAIELAPVVGGAFTVVGQLRGDLPFPRTRNMEDASVHGDTVDRAVVSQLMRRGEIPFTVQYLYDHATHDETTGLEKHFNDNNTFGLNYRGPSYVADTQDDIIVSGQLTQFSRIAGEDASVYRAECVFKSSGLMKINGTIVGSLAS